MGGFARALSARASRLTLGASDADLAQLLRAELLDSPAECVPKLVSIDIFDTLLLRNEKCEARRFWEMSELVRRKLRIAGNRHGPSTQDLFVARYMAMRASYNCGESLLGCREGRILQTLATQIDVLGLAPDTQSLFLDAELEFEAANLTGNSLLVAAVHEALGHLPLIGLSDMYLSAGHIETLIDRVFNGQCRLQKVFSSADITVSKRSGHAFRHVAQAMEVSCEELLHIGDNVNSDVIQAHRAGCRAVFFPVTHTELQARSRDLDLFIHERRAEGLACDSCATL
jgi:predicted HAD superfamily hydrolase